VAIGSLGADETGIRLPGAAAGGCMQGLAENFLDNVTGSDLGTDLGLGKDANDIVDNLSDLFD
jgi:hypothetical protein